MSVTEHAVSVVIPTYNRAALCVAAVESVFEQVDVTLDVIVVDDGSTDDTVARLAARFGDRIRVITKPNSGVANSRNLGVRHARHDLIAFLDSDDAWVAGKLKKQIEVLESPSDFDMVLTDLYEVTPEKELLLVTQRRKDIPKDGEILNDILLYPSLLPSCVLLRKKCFDAIGGFDESLRTAEDLDFHLRFAERYRIALIPEPLVYYARGHNDSLSALEQTTKDYIFVLERFLATRRQTLPKSLVRLAYHRAYVITARSAASDKRIFESMRYLWRSIAYASSLPELTTAVRGLKFFGWNVMALLLRR